MSRQLRTTTITLNPAIDQTITVSNFRTGEVNRVVSTRSDPGGKGVNVASILADYGLPVVVTGFLGADNDQIFRHLFEQKGIDDRFVRISGRTRTGIKVVDPLRQRTTDINFPSEAPSSADLEQLFAVFDGLLAECDWFVFSGSLPAGVPVTLYRDLIQRAAGKKVALDTSGEAFRRAIAAAPAVIKPNIEELSQYLGRPLATDSEVLDAASGLLRRGVETVVVSMGKQGALYVEADEAVRATPPEVVVQSTVGAGDAMVAGIVAGKQRGLSLPDCARLATAFSVDAVTHIGSGLTSREAIESIAQQVAVTPVSLKSL
ncbi:MAG: 1-phosphofructokinase [Anaerolineae bacterium]|nr:1-phosphofructokinase [Anaerolineae bacterium]